MSLPAVYLPDAEDDVYSAYARYEGRLSGLGDRFLEALRAVVNRIRHNPRIYAPFRRDIRAVPLRRFPYVVYYRDRGTDVMIIAVNMDGAVPGLGAGGRDPIIAANNQLLSMVVR